MLSMIRIRRFSVGDFLVYWFVGRWVLTVVGWRMQFYALEIAR